MIDRYKHQQVQIVLASPEKIRSWAEKILPNGEVVGEVKKPYTFHYKTNQPEKDGLFCERIFGPIQSGICACGNYRSIETEKEGREFCEQCGVEFVDSRIRRYQMGYIKLRYPVAHVWYLKRFSYIANLLDKPLNQLEDLVYRDFSFARSITKKPTFLRLQGLFHEDEIQLWKDEICFFFTTRSLVEIFRNREISTGAGAIRELLADSDLRMIIDESLVEWEELVKKEESIRGQKKESIRRRKDFLVRRMELAKHLIRTNVEPEWMVLCLLPVLPPELRPMIQIDGGKLMSSDMNELYRRVIRRNNALIDFLRADRFTPGELVMGQERLLQEAVDALLDNGARGQSTKEGHNKVYKSFSDIMEGKEGRFRKTLLGKRVDYSGRSVIVVGPWLSLHQCGLPREIAIELFQTFLIRDLIRHHIADNIVTAKMQIRNQKPIVWKRLKKVMQGHPVLLNRAPTLHRLGIQAFEPILLEERAIYLHPLVCKGFNADFDGDQMGVHVPLSLEAQVEAYLLMLSNGNLLSPAIGDPICTPTQDMLIGLYVLTIGSRGGIRTNRYNPFHHGKSQNTIKEPYFLNSFDVLGAYHRKQIHLNSPLWFQCPFNRSVISSKVQKVPIEVQYESLGTYHEIYEDSQIVRSIKRKDPLCVYIRSTAGHIYLDREIRESLIPLIQKYEK
uniref:RNA polymerase beta' subunit n=1 Tax=Vallisneria natans TaxID=62345 RepID=UPI0022FD3DB7|nr:RNA polymerase beta' subunit [Vallisneria natans]WAO28659.1 RNA polymerase beta' subunit [Vallisneria natans]